MKRGEKITNVLFTYSDTLIHLRHQITFFSVFRQNFNPSPPNDDVLFDDEIVKYRKERMKAAKSAATSSSSRVGVSERQVPGQEFSESQEEAMSELAAALEFTRTSQANYRGRAAGPADNDVTSILGWRKEIRKKLSSKLTFFSTLFFCFKK